MTFFRRFSPLRIKANWIIGPLWLQALQLRIVDTFAKFLKITVVFYWQRAHFSPMEFGQIYHSMSTPELDEFQSRPRLSRRYRPVVQPIRNDMRDVERMMKLLHPEPVLVHNTSRLGNVE